MLVTRAIPSLPESTSSVLVRCYRLPGNHPGPDCPNSSSRKRVQIIRPITPATAIPPRMWPLSALHTAPLLQYKKPAPRLLGGYPSVRAVASEDGLRTPPSQPRRRQADWSARCPTDVCRRMSLTALTALDTSSHEGAIRFAVSFGYRAATAAPSNAAPTITAAAAAVTYSDIHPARTDTNADLGECSRQSNEYKCDCRQAENDSFSHVWHS
jgi:hypothetical protein